MFRGGIIIVNPGDGPGTHFSTSYGKAMKAVRDAERDVKDKLTKMFDTIVSSASTTLVPSLFNSSRMISPHDARAEALAQVKVLVVGYVQTDYGNINMSTVMGQVAKYRQWYDIDGFFIDEASTKPSQLNYFKKLANEIRKNTSSCFIVTNPGSMGTSYNEEGYINTSDVILFQENFFSKRDTWKRSEWVRNYPKNRFGTLYHGVPSVNAMRNATAQAHAKSLEGDCDNDPICIGNLVYLTDDSFYNNPWDELPSWWNAHISALTAQPTYFPNHSSTNSLLQTVLQAVAWLRSTNGTNRYKSGSPFLDLYGPNNSTASTQCATFISLLMRHVFGYGKNFLYKWMNSTSPYAKDYYKNIVNENGFLRIYDLYDVMPGDLISMKYLGYPATTSNTGHMMLVVNITKLAPGDQKAPIISGTDQWEVWVADSSASYHGPLDTRKIDSGAGGGIGIGVARLYSNKTGDYDARRFGWGRSWNASVPVFKAPLQGYTWSMYSNSKYYNNSGTGSLARHIAIGRPTFNYFVRQPPAMTTQTTTTAAPVAPTTTTKKSRSDERSWTRTEVVERTTQHVVTTMPPTTTTHAPTTTTKPATAAPTTTTSGSSPSPPPPAAPSTTIERSYTMSAPHQQPAPQTTKAPTTKAPTTSSANNNNNNNNNKSESHSVERSSTFEAPVQAPPTTTTTNNNNQPTSSSSEPTMVSASTITATAPAPTTFVTSATATATATAPTTSTPTTTTTTTSAPIIPTVTKVTLKVKSAALATQSKNSSIVASVIADLAKKLGVQPSQIHLSINPVSSSTTSTTTTTSHEVQVVATVTGGSSADIEQAAKALDNSKSTSWLNSTKTALVDAGESNVNFELLSASAAVVASTTEAPGGGGYCADNIVVCVVPAVGGFVLLLGLLILMMRRRRGAAAARAVSEVEGSEIGGNHIAWFQAASPDGTAVGEMMTAGLAARGAVGQNTFASSPSSNPYGSNPNEYGGGADDDLDGYFNNGNQQGGEYGEL